MAAGYQEQKPTGHAKHCDVILAHNQVLSDLVIMQLLKSTLCLRLFKVAKYMDVKNASPRSSDGRKN